MTWRAALGIDLGSHGARAVILSDTASVGGGAADFEFASTNPPDHR